VQHCVVLPEEEEGGGDGGSSFAIKTAPRKGGGKKAHKGMEREAKHQVKVDLRAVCVEDDAGDDSEDDAGDDSEDDACDDVLPWLTFKRGDRLHILKFLPWPGEVDDEEGGQNADRFETLPDRFETLSDRFETLPDRFETLSDRFETLPDWRPWRGGVSGIYLAALPDGTVGCVYPIDIRFADDADEQEGSRDISFNLPPTPDWQLPIDAFFSRRTASAPATIPSWREQERQAMLRGSRDYDPRSTALELPHDACTADMYAPAGSRFVGRTNLVRFLFVSPGAGCALVGW